MKLRRGQIVRIEFVDHVDGGSRLLKFVVYGRIAAITHEALCVESWGYVNQNQKSDSNCNRHTIIRSAIKKITRLVEAKDA